MRIQKPDILEEEAWAEAEEGAWEEAEEEAEEAA